MTLSRTYHLLNLLWLRLLSEIRYLPLRLRAMRLNSAVPDGYYERFDVASLRSRCRGDTLYVLGSGASLAELRPELLQEMSANTTMSLNYTILQSFIPVDFHVIRELGAANDVVIDLGLSDLEKFGGLVAANECYQEAVFLVQGGYYAWAANLLIGSCLLPKGTRVFRYRNCALPGFRPLGSSFASVTHGASTITDCINFGYLLGFRKIVLCGVDLYDRRYFWHVDGASYIPLPGITDAQVGEYGGSGDLAARHRVAGRLLGQIAQWRRELDTLGVELCVQNPRSLLVEVLPVHVSANTPARESLN